jgi:D-alanyl-D-alanine dipeptidase
VGQPTVGSNPTLSAIAALKEGSLSMLLFDSDAEPAGELLVDPLDLSLLVPAEPRPLPKLFDPLSQPLVLQSARGDHEPLIRLDGPRITTLAAYHRAGFEEAPTEMFLRSDVEQRLYSAAAALPDGFGLAVLDAWRPLSLQQRLFDAAIENQHDLAFVSEPSTDPRTPPPHLTGGAVDVTLTWEGQALSLGSGFDDFSTRAHAASFEATPGPVRDLRRLLYWSMHEQGFVILFHEWWHFEYGTRRWAAINDTAALYGPVHPPELYDSRAE